MTSPTNTKPWRFRRTISLRGLMVLVVIMAFWMGDRLSKVRKQAAAVASVKRYGGRVVYDYQINAKDAIDENAQPPGPLWLRERLAPDFFRTVKNVILDDTPASDADLSRLGDLTELTELCLWGTNVTDQWMSHLKSMPQLESLMLNHIGLTDETLKTIGTLSALTRLSLHNTRVSESSLSHLRKLKNLRVLFLGDLPITDAGLAHLDSLDRLICLDLSGTQITAKGIERIMVLKQLKVLNVTRTKLTGPDILKLKTAYPRTIFTVQ